MRKPVLVSVTYYLQKKLHLLGMLDERVTQLKSRGFAVELSNQVQTTTYLLVKKYQVPNICPSSSKACADIRQ